MFKDCDSGSLISLKVYDCFVFRCKCKSSIKLILIKNGCVAENSRTLD